MMSSCIPFRTCSSPSQDQSHRSSQHCHRQVTRSSQPGLCGCTEIQRIFFNAMRNMKTRIRILMCYVFSVVSYGCETWTYSKAIDHKINSFEMWCYIRMLRISRTSHTTIIIMAGMAVFLCTTENWCKGNNHDKQPEKQTDVLCGPHNEKHIRTLRYSADNN